MQLANSDRAFMYGVMAFIAYQLYQCCHQGGGGGCAPLSYPGGQYSTPGWVQQLSQVETGEDLFTPQCGMFGRCS